MPQIPYLTHNFFASGASVWLTKVTCPLQSPVQHTNLHCCFVVPQPLHLETTYDQATGNRRQVGAEGGQKDRGGGGGVCRVFQMTVTPSFFNALNVHAHNSLHTNPNASPNPNSYQKEWGAGTPCCCCCLPSTTKMAIAKCHPYDDLLSAYFTLQTCSPCLEYCYLTHSSMECPCMLLATLPCERWMHGYSLVGLIPPSFRSTFPRLGTSLLKLEKRRAA